MRPAYSPWSADAPGRSSATAKRESPFCHGVQRTCTFRKKTIPFGPQYSTEFGNTSGSMNGLQVWPAPNAPSSPQAWRRRNVVCPASTPVPKSSNSKIVLTSPTSVGMKPFTPSRLWRTPKKVWPSSPYWFSKAGSLVGRSTSNQFGSFWPD